ncbi:MAG TPA: peptidyl-prolyl cis-trans isomerase [Opitutaceae bacterium]
MLALSSMGVRAQGTTPQPPNDGLNLRFANGIAAIAEQKVITVDDIRREIAPLIPQIQRESRNEQEFNQKLEALQDDVIQNLIDRVLIVKEFYKDEKRRIPESYVDNAVSENIITQFDGDRSKFLAYLKSRGLTIREYRREVEEDIIYSYMRSQQRKSQSIVSPVKVETFYNENKDRFYQEDSVHLRLIQFTRTDGETDNDLLEKGRNVVRRLINGEKFEDIAKEVSQDARRTRGGDWGWQKRSDLKKEFSDPVFALEAGKATEPILLPEGCFILYAEERKHAGIQPIDEVRDQIERILIQQMARQSQERWLERLRRNGYVKLY